MILANKSDSLSELMMSRWWENGIQIQGPARVLPLSQLGEFSAAATSSSPSSLLTCKNARIMFISLLPGVIKDGGNLFP